MTTIRRATVGDIGHLQAFFAEAYGERTIFRDAEFLRWYFGGGDQLLNSYVALGDDGGVISHYGWIPAQIVLDGTILPHHWGVNAFTLPSVRGQGLGGELVAAVREECRCFGVIGFDEATATFYESRGFNMLGRRRFRRHVFVLVPEATREITALIGTSDRRVEALERAAELPDHEPSPSADLSAWTDEPLEDRSVRCTTLRSRRWLEWRYSPRSRNDYRVQVHRSDEHGRALVAYRAISFAPTGHRITRIVDLYGDPAAVRPLVRQVCRGAGDAGHAYVEFGSFAGPYSELLEELQFVLLDGDDYAILPSLTNPPAGRPNREYVGLLSDPPALFAELSADETYFTLADSDRDRRGTLPL